MLMRSIKLGLFLWWVFVAFPAAWAQPPHLLKKEALLNLLDQPQITILDVRAPHHWQQSDIMIKGAIRRSPAQFAFWVTEFPKKQMLILYCA